MNLNVVLHDLAVLPHTYLISGFSPDTRLRLLDRMFFYEFFRFRETFAGALRGLQLAGVIDKSERRKCITELHEAFSDVIQLRNDMVHAQMRWVGKDQTLLFLAKMADDRGFEMVDRESGITLHLSEPLQRIVDRHVEIFHREGCKMSAILERLTAQFAELLLPADPSLIPDATGSGSSAG